MKKLFLFATIAAAGLFVSCSSTDDTLSDAPNNPIESVDDETPQAINIGIGNIAQMATRGTGTIGSTATEAANYWAGQSINVFMFKKNDYHQGTLDLARVDPDDDTSTPYYYATEMITPGADENLIPGMRADVTVDAGEAMIKDGTIQYYPLTGNYDFFGYHLDDALDATAIASSATVDDPFDKTVDENTKWTVPFKIDGSQDLMSTKAALTTYNTINQVTVMDGSGDYYSAKAARKGVQPVLTFNHLLSRLRFLIKGGNEEAVGYVKGAVTAYTFKDISATMLARIDNSGGEQGNWTETSLGSGVYRRNTVTITAAAYDAITDPVLKSLAVPSAWEDGAIQEAKAVKVTGIQIKSKTTGKMVVAWKDEVTGYTMSSISPKIYATLPTANQANWDPDNAVNPTKYTWNTTLPTLETFANLHEIEKKASVPVYGTALTDADKLIWDNVAADAIPTVYLKERAHRKKNSTATLAVTDFAAYDALGADPTEDAIAALGLDDIITEVNTTGLISKYVYEQLNATGMAKFGAALSAKEALKENLVSLSPTAPGFDAGETGDNRFIKKVVGDALLVHPNADQDYEMRVTVEQEVRDTWNDTGTRKEKQSFDLTIKAPTAGFVMNTSYDVILTVYGMERIEVITVIKPWEDTADDIEVGED